VIAVEIAGPTVGQGALVGSLITLLGIGVGIWYLLYLLRDLGPQIRGAVATMRPLTKRLLLVAALAVVRVVHGSRHASGGTIVTPHIREFLAGLTEQDIQVMNKWKWSAYRHQDLLAVRIACEEIAEERRDTRWKNRVVF
jgi:hypothetical protein